MSYAEERVGLQMITLVREGANLRDVLERITGDIMVHRRAAAWRMDFPVSIMQHGSLYTAWVMLELWPPFEDEDAAEPVAADKSMWTVTATGGALLADESS